MSVVRCAPRKIDTPGGTEFTTVGYGRQSSYRRGTPADEMLTDAARVRMIAKPVLMQYVTDATAGDFALHVSTNSRRAAAASVTPVARRSTTASSSP